MELESQTTSDMMTCPLAGTPPGLHVIGTRSTRSWYSFQTSEGTYRRNWRALVDLLNSGTESNPTKTNQNGNDTQGFEEAATSPAHQTDWTIAGTHDTPKVTISVCILIVHALVLVYALFVKGEMWYDYSVCMCACCITSSMLCNVMCVYCNELVFTMLLKKTRARRILQHLRLRHIEP